MYPFLYVPITLVPPRSIPHTQAYLFYFGLILVHFLWMFPSVVICFAGLGALRPLPPRETKIKEYY